MLRYDPDRVSALQEQARRTVEQLATVTSDDPAATGAVGTARAARQRLERDWLPLIAGVVASDAMVTWSGSHPGGPSGDPLGRWSDLLAQFLVRHGAPRGAAMAETARAVIEDGDVDDVEDLIAALRAADGDDEAVRAFFTDLAGAGVADLLMALGTQAGHGEEALELALLVRTRLGEDSRRSGFPTALAPSMVSRFVAEHDDGTRSPAAALSFLVDDTTFGTDLLAATVTALVDEELAAAGDEPDDGAALWSLNPVPSVLYRALDDEPEAGGTSELLRGSDPMYALLETLSGDGDAGRAVFTDERLAAYLFGRRNVGLDGMRRLAAAAERAAAGPDVVTGADPRLLDDAGMVASAFVNHVGSRPVDVLMACSDNAEVSRSLASILGQHVLAVQTTVLIGDQDAVGMRPDHVSAALVDVQDEARGDGATVRVAWFDEHALGVVTDLAVGRTEGLAVVRAALDIHQQNQAALAVGRLAAGDLPPGRDPNLFLAEVMRDAARLEAHVIAHAGHRAEERGRSVDTVIGAWIGLASLSIGGANSRYRAAGGPSARLSAPVIGSLLGPAADLATSLFATHQAGAARAAEANAEAATDQLLYLWYREAYRQGVIVPELPAGTVAGGELVDWETFLELPPSVRQQALNHLEETTGPAGVNLDGNALRDAVKTEQLASYQALD